MDKNLAQLGNLDEVTVSIGADLQIKQESLQQLYSFDT